MPASKKVSSSVGAKGKPLPKTKASSKKLPLQDLNRLEPSGQNQETNWSSFRWDVVGVFLFALGLVLFLGGLGVTKGVILDAILHRLAVWFGVGRIIIPIALLLAAWLLLSRQRKQQINIKIGRIILVELGVLFVLGTLSAFTQENVLSIEAGESLGGSIGWGLAHPLVALMGWALQERC